MKQKQMIIVAILILLGIIIYKKSKATTTPNMTGGNSGSNSQNGTTAPAQTADTILNKGDKGAMVQQLQIELNKRLLPAHTKLAVDGHFGEKTLAVLQMLYGEKVMRASVNMIKTTPAWTAAFL